MIANPNPGIAGKVSTVTPNPINAWIAKGSVRGLISRHLTERAARRAVARDQRSCRALGSGAYSDAKVYAVHVDGTMTGPYPAPE